MDHPHIVKLYEVFEDSAQFYLVMDFLKKGELFDEVVRRGKFKEHDAAEVMG
jgi:serine/threonine protein kinase